MDWQKMLLELLELHQPHWNEFLKMTQPDECHFSSLLSHRSNVSICNNIYYSITWFLWWNTKYYALPMCDILVCLLRHTPNDQWTIKGNPSTKRDHILIMVDTHTPHGVAIYIYSTISLSIKASPRITRPQLLTFHLHKCAIKIHPHSIFRRLNDDDDVSSSVVDVEFLACHRHSLNLHTMWISSSHRVRQSLCDSSAAPTTNIWTPREIIYSSMHRHSTTHCKHWICISCICFYFFVHSKCHCCRTIRYAKKMISFKSVKSSNLIDFYYPKTHSMHQ